MKPKVLSAEISRRFFEENHIYRYRMNKIADMSDDEVILCCHWYCEETRRIDELEQFRAKLESEYLYCPHLDEFIDEWLCYDIQMISIGYIKHTALPDYRIDVDKAKITCKNCGFAMGKQ